MHASRLGLVLAAFLLVTSLAAGSAAAGPGTKAVESANKTVSRLLAQKAEPGSLAEKRQAAKVTAELRGFLDVDELGKRALVDHWKTLTEAQRTEFMSLLRQLIEANYIKGLRANLDYKVRYLGEKPKGAHLVVATEVEARRRGRPYVIGIEYILRRDGKRWRTFDVVTDGVGLVENYRAMFNKIIAKEGFDGLLRKMQKKLAKL